MWTLKWKTDGNCKGQGDRYGERIQKDNREVLLKMNRNKNNRRELSIIFKLFNNRFCEQNIQDNDEGDGSYVQW